MAKKLSLKEARRLRDEGIEAIDNDANLGFKLAAIDALEAVAKLKHRFIVDDIWAALDAPPDVSDNRAMGAVTLFGVREGWITPTMIFVPSAQPQCHANPRRVWESRIQKDTIENY